MKSIMETLKKILTNNGMLKIISFVIAAIIWLAVINVNDPTKTVTINNIPIAIVNEEAITSNNQVYTVSSRQYVDVTVSGRRSIVQELNTESFIAEASMEELSVTNSIPVSVSLKNKNIAGKVTISKQSVSQIMVEIEKIIEKKYSVEEKITGSVEKNYELGSVQLAKSVVGITAPESIHRKIDSVVVDVNVDGATTDFTEKYKVVMLDKDGNQIGRNENVTLSNKKIQTSVQVYKLKKVPIVVETTGNPAKGYEIASVETDMEEITIAGPSSIVNDVKEIRISGEDADVTGITEDVEKTVNLINYLVSGVYIRGEAEVKLNIKVEGDVTKQITLNVSDIKIEELSPDYEVEFLSKNIEVTLSGKDKDFENVSADSLKASINLKGAREGKETKKVDITVPDGLQLIKSDKLKIRIVKKEK